MRSGEDPATRVARRGGTKWSTVAALAAVAAGSAAVVLASRRRKLASHG
jgi:hypothetical protein